MCYPSGVSRAERRHHAARIAANRRPAARAWTSHGDASDNQLATRHPLDCGHARCGMCHGDKRWGGGARRQAAKRAVREALA